MVEGCTRKVAVFPIVVVTSLLLGSFVSLADHPQVGQTEWAKYEGSDGYMTVEEDEFDSKGAYMPWVYVWVAPGTGEDFCDTASAYDFMLRDENGSTGRGGSEYFIVNPGCDDEWEGYLAPFVHYSGTGVREESYECMIIVGYVDLRTWNGGSGTYEWDTNYKIYVEDLDHQRIGWKDGCVEVDDSFPLVLILGAVVITATLIGAAFFYRKKSAATGIVGAVAEPKSEEEAEAAEEEVAEEEAVEEEVVEEESPVGDETVLESEKEQEFLVDDSPSMFCPNCGQQNEIGGKFCKDCGTKLT